MPIDRPAAERAVAALLDAMGHDARSELLRGTPGRFVQALERDLLSGETEDPAALLREGDEPAQPAAGLVAVRDIQVACLCPHHLLPGIGRATVAYLPGERVLGIGAIARLLDVFSRRLTLQETIGERVVEALTIHAGARGAYCRLSILHTCLAARGARQPEATVVTLATAGELSGPDGLRAVSLAIDPEDART